MPKEGSTSAAVKFVCSYGGRILPRRSDGELRYVGGLTRVLAVDRSVSYSELMAKLSEFCGFSATLRCQLPAGDFETLVSVKSEEDLANLLETYDGKRPQSEESSAPSPVKIRAVLAPASAKESINLTASPPSSTASSTDVSPNRSPRYSPRMWLGRRRSSCSPPPPAGPSSPVAYRSAKLRNYPCCYSPVPTPRAAYIAPPCSCNHWQLGNPNSPRIRIN